ncbi:hypothetical protein [Paraburkholderia sp.]|uniref:hypothetical protein n=1 Tax=Paraburkholderia sp. TaxID=1926495 RepID=UPI0039E5210D
MTRQTFDYSGFEAWAQAFMEGFCWEVGYHVRLSSKSFSKLKARYRSKCWREHDNPYLLGRFEGPDWFADDYYKTAESWGRRQSVQAAEEVYLIPSDEEIDAYWAKVERGEL